MATDILIRAGMEEAGKGTPVDTIVALSMFSNAVTVQIHKVCLLFLCDNAGLEFFYLLLSHR